MSADAHATAYEVVFSCDRCEADYLPTSGECPECGDWAFTASFGPAPVALSSRVIGGPEGAGDRR